MLHKIRQAMGKRDSLYTLENGIEVDEGFFTAEPGEDKKDKPLKCGRGSQRKSKVLVMTESLPVEGETTKNGKPRKVGHIKMFVIEDLKSTAIDEKVSKNIDKKATIDSDNSTSYYEFQITGCVTSSKSDTPK